MTARPKARRVGFAQDKDFTEKTAEDKAFNEVPCSPTSFDDPHVCPIIETKLVQDEYSLSERLIVAVFVRTLTLHKKMVLT